MTNKSFAKRLIRIRKEFSMSQKEVAEAAGISQNYYSYIENGKRRPSVDTAQKIAKVLNFDWTRFYGGGAS